MSAAEIAETPNMSRGIRVARVAGWVAAFVGLLVFFTAAKLPDDRIGALILGKASEILSSGGNRVELSAEKTRISLLLLGRIRFEGLSVRVASSDGSPVSIRWEEARISPSFLDLLLWRLGASMRLQGKDGSSLSASFWKSRSDGKFSVSSSFDKADLGASGIGLLPILAGVQATLPISGSLSASGDTGAPATLSGNVQLSIGRTELPSQKIAGFPIPSIRIADGEIRGVLSQGRLKLETLKLGRMDRDSDDLRGTASGDLAISQNWISSQLNLKTRFKISDSILKSLFILESLLGAYKQADGSYSMRLSGPLSYPQMQPEGASP